MSKNEEKFPSLALQQKCRLSHGMLSYREMGDHNDVVLFLHGLLGSSKSWLFQLPAFAKDYRAIAWDAPGFGQSALLAVNIDAYVEALREFIAHLGEKAVHLVGHSMGGSIAARFAAKYPTQVKKLILSCTHPGYADPESAPMSEKFEKRMQEYAQLGAKAYGECRARDLMPAGSSEAVIAFAAEVASEVKPDGLRNATRMLQLADNRPLLPKIKAPTLILTGMADKVVQPHLRADLLALTPFKKHVDMPEMAHAPYFQAPDYYNGLITDFLHAH